MKKNNLLLLLSLLWIAGCEDKVMENDGGNEPIVDGKGYIALNIIASESDGPGSKAWGYPDPEFDAGSEDESVLCPSQGCHWVFLFKGDKYVSRSALEQQNPRDATEQEDAHKYNEKIIGTYTAEIKLDDISDKPDHCLVVLNVRPNRIDEVHNNLVGGSRTLPNGEQATSDADYILRVLTRTLDNEAISKGGQSVVLFTPGNATGEKAKNYCTMSSTTYVEGEAGAATGRVHTMELIDGTNMASTREEAMNHPMYVHVERLAAKVEVTIAPEATKTEYNVDGIDWGGGSQWPVVITPAENSLNQSDGETVTPAKWACLLWGWSTNAHARREYLFKSLNDAVEGADKSVTSDVHHDRSEANINTQFFANWNDPERHRSYWAVDGYYSNPESYPFQYRKAYDNSSDKSYGELFDELDDKGRSEDSPLFYFTYKELRLRALGYSPFSGVVDGNYVINGNLEGSRRFRYIPENVLGQELLENDVYLGASTHVIFIGQMLLGDEVDNAASHLSDLKMADLQSAMDWVKDKYLYGGYWYDKAGYMQQAYAIMFRVFNDGDARTFNDIFGDKEPVTTPAGEVTLKAKKAGVVDITLNGEFMKNWVSGKDDAAIDAGDENNPFQFVPAEITNGDGRVLLGLKEGWSLDVNGETWDENKFKSFVHTFVGYADFYKNGRMYYYTPIRHARTNVTVEPEAYEVGDIGVVRNHWYKINVKSVLRPGIPVSDPDQPIIPNIDPADQYLALDIHIVPWHVVQQDVELQ